MRFGNVYLGCFLFFLMKSCVLSTFFKQLLNQALLYVGSNMLPSMRFFFCSRCRCEAKFFGFFLLFILLEVFFSHVLVLALLHSLHS
uniref:Uncharacterized protein n=1 Tax=Ixodes ricinus TaxID=34613 RepID=A0A6B0U1N0_IXORI